MYCIVCQSLTVIYTIWIYISAVAGRASPLQLRGVYDHTIELERDVAQLWWTVNDAGQDILFEFHVKTTGWIALGISPGRKLVILNMNDLLAISTIFL